ncbi:MAG: ImmA/IrrE family metallo-endopeptidase [Myxococcota bacterium]|nr:ImmA/IrrE family metallo-endopeptidase [Myxococcota bacterium]
MTVPFKPPAVVLDELGITEPSEIDIEAIAEYCGATVLYEPLDGSAARILGRDDRAYITVDSKASPARQRFSAGHELGHWMRDRGKVAFACTDRELENYWIDDHPERRANRYAADLLLPRKLFQPVARSMAPTFVSTRELARTFTTSLIATAIRLRNLSTSLRHRRALV